MGYYCNGNGSITITKENRKKAVVKLFNTPIKQRKFDYEKGEMVTIEKPLRSLDKYQENHGEIKLEDIDITDVLTEEGFNLTAFYNDELYLSYDGNWNDEIVYFLGAISEFMDQESENSLIFTGEDDAHWKSVFSPKYPSGVKEINGIIVYLDEPLSPKNPLIKPCKEEVRELLKKSEEDDSIGRLIETIEHAMATDHEIPYRAAKYMLKAYIDDDIDSFCIAFCGWSMRSLLEKAELIKNTKGGENNG